MKIGDPSYCGCHDRSPMIRYSQSLFEQQPVRGCALFPEIYFRDLTAKAHSRLLKEFEPSAEEENWDVYPIIAIERKLEDDKTTDNR